MSDSPARQEVTLQHHLYVQHTRLLESYTFVCWRATGVTPFASISECTPSTYSFKFCVLFMYVQGVYGVYPPLCVGVCLWACGGQRRMLGVLLYPLSP